MSGIIYNFANLGEGVIIPNAKEKHLALNLYNPLM